MTNLENRISRIENSLAQVVDKMAQMEELSKEIMEGMHSLCDSLNAVMPPSTVPQLYGARSYMTPVDRTQQRHLRPFCYPSQSWPFI